MGSEPLDEKFEEYKAEEASEPREVNEYVDVNEEKNFPVQLNAQSGTSSDRNEFDHIQHLQQQERLFSTVE